MASRQTIVQISEQTHQYLKECVRMDAIVTGTLRGMQFNADIAIRGYFQQVVEGLRTRKLAHLVDPQLVRDAELEPASPPQAQPAAGNDETPRKAP